MSDTFRVLVTGSRDWTDSQTIHQMLDTVMSQMTEAGFPNVVVVHGCARGVDMIADAWARDRIRRGWRVRIERHPADWDTNGRRAGWVRNWHMVQLGADICLAWILNGSAGATQCADLAEENGIRTERFTVRTSGPMPDEVA